MALTQWQTILRQCLLKRISPDEFVKLLQRKQDVNGKVIFKTVLDCRQSFCPPRDPLPPRYLEAALLAGITSLSDAVLVFVSRWNSSSPKTFSSCELATLQEMTMLIMSPKFLLDTPETTRCLLLSSKWLTAIVHYINRNPSQEDPSIRNLSETCGSFLATLSATNAGISILSQKKKPTDQGTTDILETVGQAVEQAITLYPDITAQLMDRLSVVQKHIAIVNQTENQPNGVQEGDLQALQFQAHVADSQMMASRSGTLLYLEAMLFTGRTVDDTTLFNFLEGRHSNDYNSMFLDILFSSFQLLKKSLAKSQLFFNQTNIFIRNKLPAALSTIASSPFATFTSEQALTEAWPELTLDLSTSESVACGQHFIHVCSLMQLVTLDKRNELLGDGTLASFSQTLLSKDDVVAEVNNGHTRLTNLVDQLVQADGSAAAIAQAIVEIIMTYCQNKETHHLKDLANSMIRKPEAINALALFIRPSYWLSPLCLLLDDWRWDEIHGESQPLYDEFGSIFLLILVSKRRLSLAKADIGVTNQSGFISRYLDQEGTEQALQDLSEDSQKHLGEWINALYIAESLNDELTTSCSPQEFYLFVPTLLRQSILAVQAGKLGKDTLKGGLEFLLEPFLLPSLVSAMHWLLNAVDATARSLMLPILEKNPENKEAQSIHQTIMNMTSSANQFTFDDRAVPDLEAFRRDAISWVRNATEEPLPAKLQTIVSSHGLEVGLRLILELLLHFSGTADFLAALDIASTLVCTANRQLRDLLKLKYATLSTLLKKNQTLIAEAIVHLHRRVEAYASVLMVQDMGMDQFATLQLSNIDAVAANMDVPQAPTGSQDMSGGGDQAMDDIDQVLNESAVMSGMDIEGVGDQSAGGGLNIDDFYGLEGDMGDLDDLDLQMFSQ